MGKEGAIPFSNSLSLNEQSRIEYTLRQTSQGHTKHSMDTIPFRHGEVILQISFISLCFYVVFLEAKLLMLFCL